MRPGIGDPEVAADHTARVVWGPKHALRRNQGVATAGRTHSRALPGLTRQTGPGDQPVGNGTAAPEPGQRVDQEGRYQNHHGTQQRQHEGGHQATQKILTQVRGRVVRRPHFARNQPTSPIYGRACIAVRGTPADSMSIRTSERAASPGHASSPATNLKPQPSRRWEEPSGMGALPTKKVLRC